ncbi:MAG: PD40 domain-containing protein [Anaerolineae bacterium]|nr:PD40 domain-containing protein [Anaerolineae bacterium]
MALKQMLWVLLRWVLLILALAIMPGTASAQATCDPDAPLIQASIADAGAPRGEYVNYSYYQAANTVSSDGRVVAFETFFGEQSTVYFYVYERDTCTLTTLVEIPLDSYYPRSGPSISHDGRYVVFSTSQTDLVNNDTNGKADVFLKDLQLGTITRISLSLNGQQLSVDSFQAIMAGGGRYVVYISDYDLMRYDRQTNTRELLLAAPDERDISPLDITPDGRFVVFASHSDNIVPDDTNNREDIFVYNQQTAEVTRVSIGSNNTQGNDTAYDASISANGRYVAFSSSASNLVPGDKHLTSDVFLHDRETGQTIAVSVDSEGTPVGGSIAEISEDGRYIAFSSSSEALLPGKPLYQSEVFIRDMITGTLLWISNSPSGEWPNGYSDTFSFSEDGQYLAFISYASNLVPGDDDVLCYYDSITGGPILPCYDLFLKRLPDSFEPDTPVRNLFTTSTPTLTWTAVRFAALYEIQVDDNEDFSSPEYANAAIPSTQLQVMTSALADGLYYWRVRAINGNGLTGLWSAVDTFVLDVP